MVKVDTVYQRVLALANKEQRGYVTPLEFNLLANQAQLDIFEQYFYDINQFAVTDDIGAEYSDAVDTLEEKISIFEKSGGVGARGALPLDLYRLGTVVFDRGNYKLIEVEQIGKKKLLYILSSPLTVPTDIRPIYVRFGNSIIVFGDGGNPIQSGIQCTYVKRPDEVEWGYNVVVDKALYNASKSKDFELHSAEETKLVIKILELAGIVINKPGLVSIAAQKEASKLQQEKS